MTRSALADRCDICVYLDDPPTNANVDVGVGWEWIEWSTETVADCLWFVQHALNGCAVEHLVYRRDTLLGSSITIDGHDYGAVPLMFLRVRLDRTIEYKPYPRRSAQ